jgi:hypothetical protein
VAEPITSPGLSSSNALEKLHAALQAESGSAYLLAADLSIQYVNDGWRRFARENGAPELADNWCQIGAVNRYVLPQLRDMFQSTYLRVLAQRTKRSYVYECSSKLVYRKFNAIVQFTPGWPGLTVVHSLVVEAPFPCHGELIDQRTTTFTDARGLIVRCSACGRLRRVDGLRWEWAPRLVTPEMENVSDGICPICALHYYGD